jgi:branched-chain amino acid transport system permease protein
MNAQVLANGLAAGTAYALVAVSFGIVCRVARFFHLAHGAVYAVAAYSLLALVDASLGLWAAIALAILIGAGAGSAMEVVIYRRLRRRSSPSAVLLLASLGILVCAQNLLSLIFGDATRRISGRFDAHGVSVLGAHFSRIQLITICTSVVVTLLLVMWERFSRSGLLLRAVADDPELSTVVGLNTERILLVAFALGSALASVAGVLAAYDTDLTPAMGFHAILMGVVAALIGGMESSAGAFAGGILLGISQHYAAWFFAAQWQDAIVFVLLVLVLLARPTGLFGSPIRKATV